MGKGKVYVDKKDILNLYFDKPTQVMFYTDLDECDSIPKHRGGIGYCAEIINGEDGYIISLEEISKIIVMSWINISDEIIGD